MFIDPEGRDVLEAGFISGHLFKQRLDRAPHGVPGRAELKGQTTHRGVLTTQLPDRPPPRARRQQPAPHRKVIVLFGERPGRTGRLDAAPHPLAPDQLNRTSEAGHVDQPDLAAAVAVRDDPARRTAHQPRRRLDHHPQPGARCGDVDDVEPVEADQRGSS